MFYTFLHFKKPPLAASPSMDTSLFIVPKRRKVKAEEELSKSEKRPRRYYVAGVLIFDEQQEQKKKEDEAQQEEAQRNDIEFEYAETPEVMERKKKNAMVAAFFASHIYLDPVNVRYLTTYWLSQYVNYKLNELDWFGDHITNIMIHPVRLEFSSTQGIAFVHANLSKYTLLMQLMGSPLHAIPSEYFVHKDSVELLECLVHFLEPRNHCFSVSNTFGLKGELTLAAFQYNRILSFFYEPSFIIIDSYLIWVHYLLSIPQYRVVTNFLPQVKHVAKVIDPRNIPWERLFSLNTENTNYDEKRRVFEEDMSALYKALSHLDIDSVKNELTFLWSKKASYVSEQVHIRLSSIENRLYPD